MTTYILNVLECQIRFIFWMKVYYVTQVLKEGINYVS